MSPINSTIGCLLIFTINIGFVIFRDGKGRYINALAAIVAAICAILIVQSNWGGLLFPSISDFWFFMGCALIGALIGGTATQIVTDFLKRRK